MEKEKRKVRKWLRNVKKKRRDRVGGRTNATEEKKGASEGRGKQNGRCQTEEGERKRKTKRKN